MAEQLEIWTGIQRTLAPSGLNKNVGRVGMTDMFNTGPIDNPQIPIHIAGVNEHNCRLAGELCEGLCLHPVSSRKYVN